MGQRSLATLLEWVLGAYSAAFETLEQQLEEFDVEAMRGNGADSDIEKLVARRRRVGVLRRALAAHRSARDAKESIVGSFDVLIARTGHRTNHVMKVLTLTSVIFLPGALLAGVMGMNFKVGLFSEEWMFYVVIALILSIAPIIIGTAKRYDWI